MFCLPVLLYKFSVVHLNTLLDEKINFCKGSSINDVQNYRLFFKNEQQNYKKFYCFRTQPLLDVIYEQPLTLTTFFLKIQKNSILIF